MSCRRIGASACWLLLMAGAGLPQAHTQTPTFAQPAGVYAKIDIETAKTTCPGYKNGTAHFPSCIHKIYEHLFRNPVISGLTVGERWDNIQISSPGCGPGLLGPCYLDHTDWTFLDDAFAVAKDHGGTVQLIITPGVDTPRWVLMQIPSCDALLDPKSGPQPAQCGEVTINKFQQQHRADGNILPLPWDAKYRDAWISFLGLLKDRYNISSHPEFVAIAVAGPNAASDEIIYPTSAYGARMGPGRGKDADTAWPILIQFGYPNESTAFWNSDQAFVKAWNKTIDDFEGIFSGITLVLSPDAGNYLPEIPSPPAPPTEPDNQALFNLDCLSSVLPDSCAAKTDILSYFLYNHTTGPNAKATQVGGMTAANAVSAANSNFGIGIGGVKLLTIEQPSLPQPTPPAILGGAEFDHPISNGKENAQKVGCPTQTCTPPLTAEEAAYDVLSTFFHGTPAAYYYGGLTGGVDTGVCGKTPAPIQYLDVPYIDILNALTYPVPTVTSRIPGLGTTSLETLFTYASQDLLAMANGENIPTQTCP